MPKSYKEMLHSVSAFVFELDGVLAANTVQFSAEGDFLRTVNTRDCYAIKAAKENGYQIFIISEYSCEQVSIMLQQLEITGVYSGVANNVQEIEKYLEIFKVNTNQVLFMGNDLVSYNFMKGAEFAACPQDAVPEIKAISHYISHKNGGNGAIRDVIEQVMKVHGKWMLEPIN